MKLYLFLLTILLNKCYSDASGRRPRLNTTEAVFNATEYLLKMTKAENGGKNVMPRTVVALAFAARSGSISDSYLSSLRKELNIQIYMHLIQQDSKPSLFELSQYVNALLATCQDPRNFNGMNLVAQLRSGVESAWRTLNRSQNEVPPFPLLTLCIAGDTTDYSSMLYKTLRQTGNDRLSLKALAVMALACRSVREARDRPEVQQFRTDVHSEFNTTDVYTKSLCLQALFALKVNAAVKLSLLQQHQLPDGSFGDSVSTYHAIPALLYKSLLDLGCKNSSIREQPISRLSDSIPDVSGKVTYSLWIDQDSLSITHSIKIGLHFNETFYGVMRRAEEENEAFSFLYDSTRAGIKVYSLAGIPNDVESRKSWNLYRGFGGNVRINSKQNLQKETKGVDEIWPRNNDYFVFWFERDSN